MQSLSPNPIIAGVSGGRFEEDRINCLHPLERLRKERLTVLGTPDVLRTAQPRLVEAINLK
jgi:hypothetical protein